MQKWMVMTLGLAMASPALAEKYDCEFGSHIYHQVVPCDDPEGHVYHLRKEEREQERQDFEDQWAQRWRSVSDNDVYMVLGMAEAYLQRHMKDPDSFDVTNHHSAMQNNSGYKVTMTYRARNGFGGMSVESATVFLDDEMNGRNIITLD